MMARAALLGLPGPTLALADHYAANQRAITLIDRLSNRFDQRVQVFDVTNALCADGTCRFMIDDFVAHHDDTNHLALSAAEAIVGDSAVLMKREQNARWSHGSTDSLR